MSFFDQLKQVFTKKDKNQYFDGFKETGKLFSDSYLKLSELPLDDEFYKQLMRSLLESDLGLKTSEKLIDRLKKSVKKKHIRNSKEAIDELNQHLLEVLGSYPIELTDKCTVILMVGVNGSGKTTSSAKLAFYYQQHGKKVLLIGADTFRAGAGLQLQRWAEEYNVDFYGGEQGRDPASVVVDGCRKALDQAYDVVIVDTAGRLQTKNNLMAELEKINRVIEKTMGFKAQHRLLVLDASTGQNAFSQAEAFMQHSDINALICTKLDGSARGGVLIALSMSLNLPIAFIGLGEKVTDLKVFDKSIFIASITERYYNG